MAQQADINALSDELLLNIFTQLPVKDLISVAETCQKWHRLSNDDLLWRKKCQEEEIPEASSSWKDEYIKHYTIDQNWRKKTDFSSSVVIPTGNDFRFFSGDILITRNSNNEFHMWSVENGEMLKVFCGHSGLVRKVEIVKEIIISCSNDSTLRLWDKNTGKCKCILKGHSDAIPTFSINGNKVITASEDYSLRIWDLTQEKCLHTLLGHDTGVRFVSSKGNFVISGNGDTDGSIKVWTLETGQCLYTHYFGGLGLRKLEIVDNSFVVTDLFGVRVWDIQNKEEIAKLPEARSFLSHIFLFPESNNDIKMISIPSIEHSLTLSGCDKAPPPVSVTDADVAKNYYITLNRTHKLNLWERKSGKFVRNLHSLLPNLEDTFIVSIKQENNKLMVETLNLIYILDFN